MSKRKIPYRRRDGALSGLPWRSALGGFAWGLLESLGFFLVPDIFLSYCALRSKSSALVATLAVVAGAMVGASVLYTLLGSGRMSGDELYGIFARFPGFRMRMAQVAAQHLSSNGARGLLSGPSSGIPYRIYVVEAWKARLPLPNILLWTPFARLERIVIAPVAVAVVKEITYRFYLPTTFNPRYRFVGFILALGVTAYWIGVYAWYWGKLVPSLYGP